MWACLLVDSAITMCLLIYYLLVLSLTQSLMIPLPHLECGPSTEHTVCNRPQQNGVAKQANRLFAKRIVALLEESGLSRKYWAECLAALIHILNCCPTSGVERKTSYT